MLPSHLFYPSTIADESVLWTHDVDGTSSRASGQQWLCHPTPSFPSSANEHQDLAHQSSTSLLPQLQEQQKHPSWKKKEQHKHPSWKKELHKHPSWKKELHKHPSWKKTWLKNCASHTMRVEAYTIAEIRHMSAIFTHSDISSRLTLISWHCWTCWSSWIRCCCFWFRWYTSRRSCWNRWRCHWCR